MAAAHSVGLLADWPSTQGSALPRSTLGFTLSSAPRTEICVETNARQVAPLRQKAGREAAQPRQIALLSPPIFIISGCRSLSY